MNNIFFNKIFKFNNLLIIYLTIIFSCALILLSKSYLLEVNNSISEWTINYQGGFVRRGLLGELFHLISFKFDIPLRDTILFFLSLLFLLHYSLIYYFFKDVVNNKFNIICFFSPLFIIFPLAELEALGRKDILIPTFFIIYCILFDKTNFFIQLILLSIFSSILILTHEVSIFYLPFFWSVNFLNLKKNEILKLNIYIFIILLYFVLIFVIYNSSHSQSSLDLMCESLKKFHNENCGFGAHMLLRSLNDNVAELINSLEIHHILRGIVIIIFGFLFLSILIFNSNFDLQNKNVVNNLFNFNIISLFLFAFTLVPFAIAIDWGRWFNLSYSMTLIFYFYCLREKKIYINKNRTNYLFINNKILNYKKYFYILLILLCFSWNPKAVHKEDIGSFPIYRILIKAIKYY